MADVFLWLVAAVLVVPVAGIAVWSLASVIAGVGEIVRGIRKERKRWED